MNDPNLETLRRLVDRTCQLTGAKPPRMLHPDAETLGDIDTDQPLYFIGLVGGKEVGKTSLANALVGQTLSQPVGFGEGTDWVIAYVHHDSLAAAREKLTQIEVERVSLVQHRNDTLRSQVLLDLPDIDSIYDDHVQTTRRVLRQLLFPIWLVSSEKYADRAFHELLARVAEGNDPENFVFVVNKIDLLVARAGESAPRRLLDDFAARLTRTLALQTPPKVLAVSAIDPNAFDLPDLRGRVQSGKSDRQVARARRGAASRQVKTLTAWFESQNLDTRCHQAAQRLQQASQIVAQRVTRPVLEHAIHTLWTDPGVISAIGEPVTAGRLARWPVVNVLDPLLSPLVTLLRRNIAPGRFGLRTDLDQLMPQPGPKLEDRVRGAFVELHQTDRDLRQILAENPLWEEAPALAAADQLRARINQTLVAQLESAQEQLLRRSSASKVTLRWALTVGAIAWFPFIQPILESIVRNNYRLDKLSFEMTLLAVQMAGATYLLRSVVFLLLYFLGLWAVLRFDTSRKVARLLDRWQDPTCPQPQLSPAAQVLDWEQQLLKPLRDHHQSLTTLRDEIRTALSHL